jgi:hypothetical protein
VLSLHGARDDIFPLDDLVLPGDIGLVELEVAMFVLGIGNALSVVPTSTAAYVRTAPPDMPHAVTQINVLLRLGGAVGAALVVAVLGDQAQPRDQLVAGFGSAYWCLAACSAMSVVGALVLAGRRWSRDASGRRPAVVTSAGPGGR